jgi:hypothetical protein
MGEKAFQTARNNFSDLQAGHAGPLQKRTQRFRVPVDAIQWVI